MLRRPTPSYRRPEWKYFRKELRSNQYPLGDAYQDEKRRRVLKALETLDGYSHWNRGAPPPGDYLKYVKSLTDTWPQLQLLADFMEVGTIPTRWCIFPEEDPPAEGEKKRFTYGKLDDEQARRKESMNVALLKYCGVDPPSLHRFQNSSDSESPRRAVERLETAVDEAVGEASIAADKVTKAKLSLFVVEDLSHDVIETLGSRLGVDPAFFRAHLTDYAWNNIRDPWREPPILEVAAGKRDWVQIRFVRTRYFANPDALKKAQSTMDNINVMRRMDSDENEAFWDKDVVPLQGVRERVAKRRKEWNTPSSHRRADTAQSRPGDGSVIEMGVGTDNPPREAPVDAKVGLIRSRATLWLREDTSSKTAIGILLLDPTPEKGYLLWRGYSNWDTPPSFESVSSTIPPGPPSMQDNINTQSEAVPKTWFEDFLFWAQKPDSFQPTTGEEKCPVATPAQALLHLICADWLTFSDYLNARLTQVDWEISRPAYFSATGDRQSVVEKLDIWRRWVPQCRDMVAETLRRAFRFQWQHAHGRRGYSKDGDEDGFVAEYKRDYELVLQRLAEYQRRVDRLSSVVNSAIKLEDARNTARTSQNLGLLTILASLFIPPTFFATVLSMNDGPIAGIAQSAKWWAALSFPTLVTLGILYWLISKGRLRHYIQESKKVLRKMRDDMKS